MAREYTEWVMIYDPMFTEDYVDGSPREETVTMVKSADVDFTKVEYFHTAQIQGKMYDHFKVKRELLL